MAGVEWWNVEPLATIAQEVGCLGEGSRAQKEKSRKDTFDPFGNFAWEAKDKVRDTSFLLSVSGCNSWCSDLPLLF